MLLVTSLPTPDERRRSFDPPLLRLWGTTRQQGKKTLSLAHPSSHSSSQPAIHPSPEMRYISIYPQFPNLYLIIVIFLTHTHTPLKESHYLLIEWGCGPRSVCRAIGWRIQRPVPGSARGAPGSQGSGRTSHPPERDLPRIHCQAASGASCTPGGREGEREREGGKYVFECLSECVCMHAYVHVL